MDIQKFLDEVTKELNKDRDDALKKVLKNKMIDLRKAKQVVKNIEDDIQLTAREFETDVE
jgi:hypothetical protein